MSKHSRTAHAKAPNNGDIVSIAYRYSIWDEFEKRVEDEFKYRGYPVPRNIHKRPYSFQNIKNWDEEVLIQWQTNAYYPTQKIPGEPLKIEYEYTDKTHLADFNNYYNIITSPGKHHKVENSAKTFYGNYDKFETYRAVYQLTSKMVGEYRGMITNPPYPAIFGPVNSGLLKWLLPAVLGLATGLAAVPLLRKLRARHDE